MVSYTLTRTDLRRALMRYHFARVLSLRTIALWIPILTLIAVLALYFGSTGKVDMLPMALVAAVMATGFYFGMAFLVAPIVNWIESRRQYASSKLLREPQTIEVTPATLNISAPSGETRLRWQDIPRLDRDRHVLLVYQSNRLFYILPLDRVPAEMADQIAEHWRNRSE